MIRPASGRRSLQDGASRCLPGSVDEVLKPTRRWARVALGLVAGLLATGPASAQESIPEQLTLAAALQIAEAQSPAFRAARHVVDVARAEARIAARRPNPMVVVEGEEYAPFAAERGSFWMDQALVVRFQQEIETAGRRRHRIRSADAGLAMAQAETADARRRLQLAVGRTYFALALAQADRAVAAAALEEIERVITLTEARFAAGEVAGVELRRLDVERLSFVDQALTTDLAVRTARAALLGLLGGADLEHPIEAADPLQAAPLRARDGRLIADADGMAVGVESLRQDASAARPDLRAARRARARADSELLRQRALRVPNVTAGWGYRRDFGRHAMDFALSIPVPLYGALNLGEVTRADAERRRLAALEDAAGITVAVELQQAVDAVEVSAERVRYVEEEYLRGAEEARDLVQASYELGETALIDFLDAQREFRATQRVRNQALYDLRISLIELAAAIGVPYTGQP